MCGEKRQIVAGNNDARRTKTHPREPLIGSPSAQIGGREMIVQCLPYIYIFLTLPRCLFNAQFKDKRPLTPMSVKKVKR